MKGLRENIRDSHGFLFTFPFLIFLFSFSPRVNYFKIRKKKKDTNKNFNSWSSMKILNNLKIHKFKNGEPFKFQNNYLNSRNQVKLTNIFEISEHL